MSIAANFKVVKARLDETLARLGQPPITHELGAHHISDAASYNRIVWAVVGGPVVAAKQAGNDKSRRGLKAIRRRYERVDVHIWGPKFDIDEDRFEGTEVLMQHFNAAARVALTGFSWRAIETDWTVGQEQKTASGQLVVLRVELNLPLTFEQPTVVKGVTPTVTTQIETQA